ncbi:heterokaryon incompatibility protein-domain-containing protein [Thelonectria olida]|uniref:Heterokaryon incompatibility protein-domain-containing protein n=1 Tax=Thelonectria olida TaxID=1576542 RepID=A0A9P8W4N0_9HYPO|nr:heterokaryon incompatibility protein-domain-containing protein [Thelonectria olida]
MPHLDQSSHSTIEMGADSLCPDCRRLARDSRPPTAPDATIKLDENDPILPLSYTVVDTFPRLPKLHASVRNGCKLCRLLKNVIWSHVRSDLEVRAIANKALAADKKDPEASNLEVQMDLLEWHHHAASIKFGRGPQSWWPSYIAGHIRIGHLETTLRIDLREQAQGFYRSFPRPNPLSDDSMELIQTWLDTCAKLDSDNTLHQYCPKTSKAPAPLRLLDVMQDDTVRLVQTEGQQVKYAILSYCWGTSQAVLDSRTVPSNLKARTSEFPLKSLPQTLQDSVKLVRRLGLGFIWIDALCIVQESDEWLTESTRMMDYYENAYLTIIPVACSSADQGFLQNHPWWVSEIIDWPDARNFKIEFHFPRFQNTDIDTERSVWISRGWTFQERLLSGRVLYISKDDMKFQCRGGYGDRRSGEITAQPSIVEFLPISPAHTRDSGEWNNRDMIRSKWYQLVEKYAGRQLTYESDKLLALSGVMSKFRQFFGDANPYLDGFWKNDLCHGLLWKLPQSGKLPPATKSACFPSWSWCSVNRPLKWADGGGSIECADLVEFRVAAAKDKRGTGPSLAQLVLRAWSFPFKVLNTELPDEIDIMAWFDDGSDIDDHLGPSTDLLAIVLTTYLHGQDEVDWVSDRVTVAHDISGLVVCPTKSSDGSDITYKRLGTFEVSREVEADMMQNEDEDFIPVQIEGFESTNAPNFYREVYQSKQTLVLV